MLADNIIRSCPEPTEWTHNMVVALKKSGDTRMCLDSRPLNKWTIRSRHHTASFKDVLRSLNGAHFFSSLDAKICYWTVKLHKESQPLTAFNTPFGKFCFLRLAFGLNTAAEVFQEKIDSAMDGI